MTWTKEHKQIPFDDKSYSHGQVSAFLGNGEYLDDPRMVALLAEEGLEGPWLHNPAESAVDDGYFASTHLSVNGRESIMRRVAALQGQIANERLQADPTLPDPEVDRNVVFDLLCAYGAAASNILPGTKQWLTDGAIKLGVRDEETAAVILGGRGLCKQPRAYSCDPSVMSVFAATERAICEWGLLANERPGATFGIEFRRLAVLSQINDIFALATLLPGVVEPTARELVISDYTVDAARVYFRADLVRSVVVTGEPTSINLKLAETNPLVRAAGNPILAADDAAKKMEGLGFALHVPTRFAGLLNSQVLTSNDWRYYSGLQLIPGPAGGGVYINGQPIS